MDKNEIKKELYNSKVMAYFSHYSAGSLYYSVEFKGEIYQFPIPTFDKDWEINPQEPEADEIEVIRLSSYLGTTSFYKEMKGYDLYYWIQKAIENIEFVKVR